MAAFDDRWANAIIRPVTSTSSIEIAGLEEHTAHTAFVKVRPASNTSKVTEGAEEENEGVCSLVCIVDAVLQTRQELCPTCLCTSTADELFDIGAVWIVPRAKGCTCKARRATPDEKKDDAVALLQNNLLRIHIGSIRCLNVYNYHWGSRVVNPMTASNHEQKGVIIHEDISNGFLIIRKPAGIPCHGYVYNSRENVVSMLIESLKKRYPNECLAISCPQRLDTETSGVLAVATRSSFASYLSKLLESKTLNGEALVTKRYQCLVCLRQTNDIHRIEKYASNGEVITHYLLSDRTLPRVFRDVPDERNVGSNWLECRLRIVAVSKKSFGSAFRADTSSGRILKVGIELLTGRPHQIRGQMSAIGFPLLGDEMYGGVSFAFGSPENRIALHCCELSFPEPIIIEGGKKKSNQLGPSSKVVTYRCNDAWWDE